MHFSPQKKQTHSDKVAYTPNINSAHIIDIKLADMLQQQILFGSVFLSLGSNHNASKHLAYTRDIIGRLGQIRCSPELVNPDFTATATQPKPDYTNQCILLLLPAPIESAEFIMMMGQIEKDCQRQRSVLANNKEDITPYTPKLVTLDIDLLAFQPAKQKNWYRLVERYPFKDHELYGIRKLNMETTLT